MRELQIPFAKPKAERPAAGDPRLSVEERYATHAEYVAAVTSLANGLARERLLLDEGSCLWRQRIAEL